MKIQIDGSEYYDVGTITIVAGTGVTVTPSFPVGDSEMVLTVDAEGALSNDSADIVVDDDAFDTVVGEDVQAALASADEFITNVQSAIVVAGVRDDPEGALAALLVALETAGIIDDTTTVT